MPHTCCIDRSDIEYGHKMANSEYRYLNKLTDADIYLNVQEEQLLLQEAEHKLYELYETRALQAFTTCALHKAFYYLKRFYMEESVMKYDPMDIYLSCVSIAIKASLRDLHWPELLQLAQVEYSVEFVHKLMHLCDIIWISIVGDPIVDCVFCRSIDFLSDWYSFDNRTNTAELAADVKRILLKQFLTDAVLLYKPKIIALAALSQAAVAKNYNMADFLLYKMNDLKTLPFDKLKKNILNINQLCDNYKQPNFDLIKLARAKLNEFKAKQSILEEALRQNDTNES